MTEIFMAVIVIVIIAYDIVAYILSGMSKTISARTWALSKEYPIIPLAVGIVIGHIFWGQV